MSKASLDKSIKSMKRTGEAYIADMNAKEQALYQEWIVRAIAFTMPDGCYAFIWVLTAIREELYGQP